MPRGARLRLRFSLSLSLSFFRRKLWKNRTKGGPEVPHLFSIFAQRSPTTAARLILVISESASCKSCYIVATLLIYDRNRCREADETKARENDMRKITKTHIWFSQDLASDINTFENRKFNINMTWKQKKKCYVFEIKNMHPSLHF